MPKTKKKLIAKVTSLNDLYQRANDNDDYKKLCIVALQNLGCEGLAEDNRKYHDAKWRSHWDGLVTYVGSLVGEYGVSEDKAFRDVRNEINFCRDCIDQATLEW